MINIEDLTIEKISEGFRKKDFSATDITKAYLERVKKYDKEINSFITVCDDLALKEAEKRDKLISQNDFSLPLLGIPVGLKDLYLTKGIKTTAASKVLDNHIGQYDATAVERLKNAGAIILGKTNCDAWAHGSSGENSDFGPTRNPWNKEYIPGGSSSGSAACVTSGFAAFSTGTDTGSSILLPASFTNIVGLKPTYGLVSRYGIIAMASSLDSIGHFTKTVKDSALILNITAGIDGHDATLVEKREKDYSQGIEKGVKGLKIGIPKEYVEKGLDPQIHRTFKQSVEIFKKLGAQIKEVSLPHTEYAIAAYYIIQPSEVSSNLARYDGVRYGNPRDYFGDEAKRRILIGTFTLSAGYYDAYYKKAMQVRTLIKEDFEKVFESVNVLLTPVSPTPPWKLGEKVNDPLKMYLSDILTVSTNLSGIPGLAMPAGFTSNNLPIGIQLLGPHFSEKILFRAGFAFEQETKLFEKTPKL